MVVVEFFEAATQTVAGKGDTPHKPLEPPALHEFICRRPFIGVDPEHAPDHLLPLLRDVPEPPFLEPQED